MLDAWLRFARRILRLPAGNPPIPAGSRQSVLVWNPGPGYLGYRLLGWITSVAFSVLVLAAAAYAARRISTEADEPVLAWLPWAGLGVLAIWIGAGLAWRFATIRLELDMLRYTLTDRAVRLRRGVRELSEITISFVNVQNVRYVQGPLQRAFGIADLVIDVAGGGGFVPSNQQQASAASLHEGRLVGVGDPQRLRDLVLARVKAARGAGLGDDPAEGKAPVGLDSPQARALLVEIRDGLTATNAALVGS